MMTARSTMSMAMGKDCDCTVNDHQLSASIIERHISGGCLPTFRGRWPCHEIHTRGYATPAGILPEVPDLPPAPRASSLVGCGAIPLTVMAGETSRHPGTVVRPGAAGVG